MLGVSHTLAGALLAVALAPAASGQLLEITVRSGNGNSGGQDALISFVPNRDEGPFNRPLGNADFLAARGGSAALITDNVSGWIPQLPSDPTAQWIRSDPTGNTALYAVDLAIPTSQPVWSAILDVWFAADDVLGDPFNEGIFLNELPVAGTTFTKTGYFFVEHEALGLDVTALVRPGTNTLYIYTADTGGGPAGLLFSARLTVDAWPSFCNASDSSLASCPCMNEGLPSSGCDTAQATGGVGLNVLGQASRPFNRATMQGSGFPSMGTPAAVVIRSAGLDPAAPVVFGDGLRCVGVPVVRLAAGFAFEGQSVHFVGHSVMSGTFYYQLWFRSTPDSYCTPDGFNLSSGRALAW